ncbi:MAG: LysR family transcriptional regulator [Neobacillus sp.]|nr:LysR family transcriptional regulator [Neobacillus sp.]
MESRDWTILKVLFEQRNITKTAEILYISQPALTKRLQQMEKNYGVQIVHRGRRGVHFTPQGEYLVKCADEMLKKLQEISDNISNIDNEVVGTIRLGATYLITRTRIPRLLKLFKDKYPDVEFKVTTGWSEGVYQSLINQDIQIGVLRGGYKWQGGRTLLLQEPLILASKNKIGIEDLPKLPRIDYNCDYKLKEMIDTWWGDHFSVPPLISMSVDKSDTCKEMIVNGLGYAIVPGYVLENKDDLFRIELKDKNGKGIIRDTWMFYHEDSLKLKSVRVFVDFVNSLNFEEIK